MERRQELIIRLIGIVGFVLALLLFPVIAQRCGVGAPVTPAVPPSGGEATATAKAVPTNTSTAQALPTNTSTAEAATTSTPAATPTSSVATSPLPGPGESPLATPTAAGAPTLGGAPVYGYQIVAAYPHDPQAFTQGLVYLDGVLYEGTGLVGRSTLRRVDLETGQVLQSRALSETLFGEGVAVWGDRIYQLTWQSNVGFIYDRETFEPLGEWSYPGEGWGLTHDGTHLIMSDGTAALRFLDPADLSEVRRVVVRDAGGPVGHLNELEYIAGEVYANIWLTPLIARIDPQSGQVVGWIDLDPLVAAERAAGGADVLNGIAYDPQGDRLLITGKWWPHLYEIDLIEKK